MPDVTLILCPIFAVTQPHLGLAYLGAALRDEGLTPAILDLNLAFYRTLSEDARAPWRQSPLLTWRQRADVPLLQQFARYCEPLLPALAADESGVIGCSLYANNFVYVDHLISRIKAINPRKQIVLGGPGVEVPVLRWFFGAKEEVDFLVHGEAEMTLPALVCTLAAGGEVRLPGVVARGAASCGEIACCPRPDLDTIPPPDFDPFDLQAFDFEVKVLPILLSRGCRYRCRFCLDKPLFGPVRGRNPNLVAAEITHHRLRYGIPVFHCQDLLLNGDLKHLESLCHRLASLPLGKHSLNGQLVVHKSMTAAYFAMMRRAGFHTLNFGVESLSDRVLRLLGKPFNREVAIRTIEASARAGLTTQINLIVGTPGETEEDFQETLTAVRQLAPCLERIGSLSPLEVHPGSHYHAQRERYGIRLAETAPENYPSSRDVSFVFNELTAPACWSTASSTPDGRNERMYDIYRALADLGIPVHGNPLPD